MLAAERQNLILQRSQTEGAVRTTGLAQEFGVAEETIRRDLEKLSKSGFLNRTHGGATAKDFVAREFAHRDREIRQRAEKQSIAKVVASLVNDGETILFDASSTALQAAISLPESLRARVVTYSLPIVQRLQNHSGIELVCLGGVYEPAGRRFSSLLTEQNLSAFRIDRFFFSCKGYDPDRGVSEANEEQARLKQIAIRYAGWSALLADHSKLGMSSSYFFAQDRQLSALVSDSGAQAFFNEHPLPDSCQLHLAESE